MDNQSPPSLREIVGLPVVGAAFIEVVHTRNNELELLLAPFMIVVIRLFIAQFQAPPIDRRHAGPRALKAVGRYVAVNQLAAFVLLLVEFAVVLCSSPSTPGVLWLIAATIFLLYVGLRLFAGRYWTMALEAQAAEELSCEGPP